MSGFDITFKGVPSFADEELYVVFSDPSGAPYDWTGSVFEMRIGLSRGGGSPLLTLTQGEGDIVPSIVDGKSRITWRFRPEKVGVLLPKTTHVHDIIRTVGGRQTAFASGTIIIQQGVKA